MHTGPRVTLTAIALVVAFGASASQAGPLGPVDVPLIGPSMALVGNVPHGVGQGLWVHEGYAYASGQGHTAVIDIRDPTAPVLVSKLPMNARDVDVLEIDGRTVVGVAAGGAFIHFIDATDPQAAVHAGTIELGGLSHNLVALPGTSLFYNSRGFVSGIDIIDASDPAQPQLVTVWDDGYTCHDITTYPDVDRAYCAGIDATYVLDITDPREPVTLLRVDNPDIHIHHWAIPTPDHNTLVIGDEKFGDPDGCMYSVTLPVGTVSARTGAVWFYDISSIETGAVEKAWVSLPPQGEGPCTAHFGDMIEGTSLLAVGWYIGGTVLIDYDGPGTPRLVAQHKPADANAWDARYADGHLFVGDQNRGLDVLRVDLPGLL